jgi:hypothetical protein
MRGVLFRPLDGTGIPPQLTAVSFGLAWRRDTQSAVTREFIDYVRSLKVETPD